MLSSEGVWRNPSLAQTGAYGGSAAGASLGKSTMLAAASGTGKGGRLTDPTGMRERRTGPTNLDLDSGYKTFISGRGQLARTGTPRTPQRLQSLRFRETVD